MGSYRARGVGSDDRGAAVNTVTVAGRLEALQRSLEAARSTPHSQVPASIRQQHDLYMQGLNDGVQLAIDAIAHELKTISAGQLAAHQ